MKKKILALFAIMLIVAGACLVFNDGSTAYAAEIIGSYTDENSGDFKAVQYSDISEFRKGTYTSPAPTGYEDYLFAGWYEEQECLNALPSSKKEGSAWAKFVPAGVLSVKSQIQYIDATGKYNMRIVSTLDTLNYGAVGFKVQYHNGSQYGSVKNVLCKEVYTRIKATAQSGVDYKFSPKVVDTKSEYFMTATLVNIGAANINNTFRIVPYWKTMDGTTVYGVNRYVTVNDGIYNDDATTTNDVFSFNVKQDALSDWNELAVTGVDASNVTYRHKDGDDYVSVIVSGQNESTMSSATKFVITGADDESINVVHRNYNTTHIPSSGTTPNADYSWYTVYNGLDATEKEYVIATSADLYGLAKTVNSNAAGSYLTFDQCTIYVVSDITINDGTASPNGFTMTDSTQTRYPWTPIGSNSNKFKGTFDGQMHEIDGIYLETSSQYAGFFGYVRDNAVIQKFSLKNSYFQSSAAIIGSVVGQLGGTLDTVYSNAHIVTTNAQVGGLVGRAQQATASITTANEVTNCCFEGSVTMTVASASCYAGGIVGSVVDDALNISDCLNKATITANITTEPAIKTHTFTSGICGGVMNAAASADISDILNTGDVNVYYNNESNDYFCYAASVVCLNAGTADVTRAYGTSNQSVILRKKAGTTSTKGYWNGDENDIKGTVAYLKEATNSAGTTSYGKLGYYTSSNPDGKWIVREDDVPALKSFVTDGIDVGWYYDNISADTYTISTEEEFYGLSALTAAKSFSTTRGGETYITTIEAQTFEGKTINLTDDIKLNSGKSSEWVEGTKDVARTWPMIGRTTATAFNGTFDGNGHTIKGVYMNNNVSETYTAAGLFGETNHQAVIKNFKLTNSAFVTSGDPTTYLGSVVGRGDGTLVNIYCDDSVIVDTEKSTTVGGIIGSIANGTTNTKTTTKCTIVNCWFDGEISQNVTGVTSHVNTGGIVGIHAYGNGTNGNKLIIDNCLYSGTMNVTAAFTGNKNLRAGGIVGGTNGKSNAVFDMSNCLSDGTMDLSKTSDTGGVLAGALFGGVGSQSDGGENYQNVYATTNCYANALGVYPTGKSTSNHDEMTITFDTSANLYGTAATLEYVYHWESSTSETPKLRYYQGTVPVNHEWYVESVGDAVDPYLIRTADELDAVATMTNNATTVAGTTFVGETIKLANDIVYNEGTKAYDTVEKWEAAEGLKQWTPIGTATSASNVTNRFQGTFDGANHSVIGLYVTDEGPTNGLRLGLFGAIKDATIKNVGVEDSYFQSSACVSSSTEIGSIAGCGDGIFDNVYSNATINVNGTRIGGLIGAAQQNNKADTLLTITDSWFEGTIVNEYNAGMQTGGLVGYVLQGTTTLTNCIYSGKMECTSTATANVNLNVGGMVGTTNAISTTNVTEFKITNSLCTGTVSTTSTQSITLNRVGYIIGNANNALEVDGVYAPIEKCTKAIGYNSLKEGSDPVVTIAEQSMWNAGAELLGFDLEGAWETRSGNTPELRAFATDDYDAGNCIGEVADTSWFNETDTTFTIVNAADFYGLSLLVSAGNTFDGVTIEVADNVEEIDLNSSWTAGSGLPDIIWNPIGCNGNQFKGTFIGNGVTIKGIYAGGDDLTNIGLFGYVHKNATLQNFYLKNSEFNQNSGTNASVGSIAAEMHGAVNTVYSEAIINSKCQYTGGLFARVNGDSTTLSTDADTGIKTCDRGIVSIQDAWYDGTMNVTYKAADVSKDDLDDTFRYAGGIFAVVIQGTVDMDNILFTGTIDTASYPSRAYAGGIAGATMAQPIVKSTEIFQDDDYTTIDLSSCISAGVVNQDGSQCSAIVGRLESGINTTKDGDVVIAAYPKDTYLKMDNVYATSECNDYVSRVTSTKPVTVTNSDSTTTEVSSTGIIEGSTVVQSQYNSDQLIGYCTEYTNGETVTDQKGNTYNLVSNLDFATETGWTMRTAGVPIPKKLSAAVEEGTLVIDPSALTSELGLTYWTNSTKTLANAINSGKGNYILNYTEEGDLTYEGFLTYLESLTDSEGNKLFKKYVVNRADSKLTPMANDGVYNSTYVNGNWVMNITYVANKGTVDVVINTFGEEALSPNLQAENVTITENGLDVKFSMLKLADAGVMGEYGNAFVFQLPNGHFIVSDGGKVADAEGLITYLKELAAADDIEDNNVYIDAWVLSHFHSDHCGALMQLYKSEAASLRENVYVKAVYVNEPNNYAKVFELNQYENASQALAGAMKFTQGAESTAKPKVYRMHTGERYYFDGVTMDVVLTQEQLDPHFDPQISISTDSNISSAYRYYGDWDGFNATSTTCVFTVTATNDKVYMGGDANKANMNYIMQAYDGVTQRLVHVKQTGLDSNNSYRYYERYTEQVKDIGGNTVNVSNITPTGSQALSGITVFVALHHGKNTSGGFTQYLFGANEKLEYVLFPYHQMYEATYKSSYTGADGEKLNNRYWMEDDSTVFDYLIKDINETLYGYADNKYYTYGYEDCVEGVTAENPHGTVELTFTLDGITTNVR